MSRKKKTKSDGNTGRWTMPETLGDKPMLDLLSVGAANDIVAYYRYHENNLTSLRDPEIMLMMGVFWDALYAIEFPPNTKKKRINRADALEWFYAEESQWIFCFDKICQQLGLDPAYLRKGIAARFLTERERVKYYQQEAA